MESNGHGLTRDQRLMLRTIGATFDEKLKEIRDQLAAVRNERSEQPLTVNVEAPPVTLEVPSINVESPTVNVAAPTVNVAAPRVSVDVTAITKSIDALAAVMGSFIETLTGAMLVLIEKKPLEPKPVCLRIRHADGSESTVKPE